MYIAMHYVMNTCVHMLIVTMCCSLHLYKRGMAPPIEDLLGKATFTGTLSIYSTVCEWYTHAHNNYVCGNYSQCAISIHPLSFHEMACI